MLVGVGVAFRPASGSATTLWHVRPAPGGGGAEVLLASSRPAGQISPMDAFNIIWVKLPILCGSLPLLSVDHLPVWGSSRPASTRRSAVWRLRLSSPPRACSSPADVSPTLSPFASALSSCWESAEVNVTPMISMTEYFDLFVDVMLGVVAGVRDADRDFLPHAAAHRHARIPDLAKPLRDPDHRHHRGRS